MSTIHSFPALQLVTQTEVAAPVSLSDLLRRRPAGTGPLCHPPFEVDTVETAPLTMNGPSRSEALRVFRSPVEFIEQQQLIRLRDGELGTEVLINGLRAYRYRSVPLPVAAQPAAVTCRWCGTTGDDVTDTFGAVVDGEQRAFANWARQAPVNGLVFGPKHDIVTLLREPEAFRNLFAAAEEYVRLARRAHPEWRYFTVFLNGGPKSAASVPHAHLQVVGGDRPFAYPRTIRDRCLADYWARVRTAHEKLGLAFAAGPCVGWANLVPVKERDITAVSPTLSDGAAFVGSVLQALADRGTRNCSLAAILRPDDDGDFRDWPPVLWRLVDRGDPSVPHADIGCMELFGSTVVATDPYLVAGWLRG